MEGYSEMNDYKELVKALRDCAWSNDISGHKGTCENLRAAADAIEQLVRERDKLKLDLCEANDVIEYVNDKLKKVTNERDFMHDYIPRQCNTCKNYSYTADVFGLKTYGCIKGGCADWKRKENWEWDGVTK